MSRFPIIINGNTYQVVPGSTVLSSCQDNNIFVPTLCNHDDVPAGGRCGLCTVKLDGISYGQACMTIVRPNMTVETSSEDVISLGKKRLDEFMDIPLPNRTPDIEELYVYFNPKHPAKRRKNELTNAIQFIKSNCVNCQRCIRMCNDVLTIGALNDVSGSLRNSECISCGMCTAVCPSGAIVEAPHHQIILKAMASGRSLVLQVAPSVRVTIGEIFGSKIGEDVTGKIISAAHKMGFKHVFDMCVFNDIAAEDEINELLERVQGEGSLPMFNTSCPAWVNFIEKHHPELRSNLCKTKTPHIIGAKIIKKHFEDENPFVVSLMPCPAGKDEIKRSQLAGDVDAVLTAREFGALMETFGIEYDFLRSERFDEPFNSSSRISPLTALPGGSIAAALSRRIGIDKAIPLIAENDGQVQTLTIGENKINIVICSGIATARGLIESGAISNIHYIEVQSCPGGCISGGGQPRLKSRKHVHPRVHSIRTMHAFGEIKINYIPPLRTHYEPQESAILSRRARTQRLPIVAHISSAGETTQYARLIANALMVPPIPITNVTLSQIQESGLAIFIVGSSGERPTAVTKIITEIENHKLDHVRFAVLAVGIPATAEALNDVLLSTGAEPLLPIASPENFEEWYHSICRMFAIRKRAFIGTRLKYQLELSSDESVITKPLRPIGFEYAEIVKATLLSHPDIVPPMHQYIVQLPKGMDYETGDHFSVLPENDRKVSEEVMAVLGLNPKTVYEVKTAADSQVSYVPDKVTVEQLFVQYLDLNGPPVRSLIQAFATSTSGEGKARLMSLLDPTNQAEFDKFCSETSVGEFIIEYTKYGAPELQLLLSACPHIRPRIFSISSAPNENRGYLELVVLSVLFGPKNSRHGLATHFLSRPGLKTIAVHCHKGVFQYPEDKTTPLVMVGLGSGVSPLVAVVQHRQSLLGGPLGEAILFFGARYKKAFPLLHKKLEVLLEKGAVSNVFTAFSRDGSRKRYVQSYMLEESKRVWELWQNPKTIFLYCGPTRGIPDQMRDAMVQVTMKEGRMQREQAEAFCERHTFLIESF